MDVAFFAGEDAKEGGEKVSNLNLTTETSKFFPGRELQAKLLPRLSSRSLLPHLQCK